MRGALLIALSATATALVLGFTLFGRTEAKAAKPSLRIVQSQPIKVRGQDFRANERVRVTAGRRVVRTKANGNGYFVITIPGADRCSSTRVLARGSSGSYVVVKALPGPECLPARTS
jgi:hypothetical protein